MKNLGFIFFLMPFMLFGAVFRIQPLPVESDAHSFIGQLGNKFMVLTGNEGNNNNVLLYDGTQFSLFNPPVSELQSIGIVRHKSDSVIAQCYDTSGKWYLYSVTGTGYTDETPSGDWNYLQFMGALGSVDRYQAHKTDGTVHIVDTPPDSVSPITDITPPGTWTAVTQTGMIGSVPYYLFTSASTMKWFSLNGSTFTEVPLDPTWQSMHYISMPWNYIHFVVKANGEHKLMRYTGAAFVDLAVPISFKTVRFLSTIGLTNYFLIVGTDDIPHIYTFDGTTWTETTPAGNWSLFRPLTTMGSGFILFATDSVGHNFVFSLQESTIEDVTPAGTWAAVSYFTRFRNRYWFSFRNEAGSPLLYSWDTVSWNNETPTGAWNTIYLSAIHSDAMLITTTDTLNNIHLHLYTETELLSVVPPSGYDLVYYLRNIKGRHYMMFRIKGSTLYDMYEWDGALSFTRRMSSKKWKTVRFFQTMYDHDFFLFTAEKTPETLYRYDTSLDIHTNSVHRGGDSWGVASATVGNDGPTVTERGFCIAHHSPPTESDICLAQTGNNGRFTELLDFPDSDTPWFVIAYAKSEYDELFWGETLSVPEYTGSESNDSSLIETEPVPPGEECENGGVRITTGKDANENGTIDEEEIVSSEVVCNGTDGQDGQDGKDGEDGADGSNGQRGFDCWDINENRHCDPEFEDSNGDGNCSPKDCKGEKGDTGTPGEQGETGEKGASLYSKTETVAKGDICKNGGTVIITWTDENGNKEQDPGEPMTSTLICNGENGAGGCSMTSVSGSSKTTPVSVLFLLLMLTITTYGKRKKR